MSRLISIGLYIVETETLSRVHATGVDEGPEERIKVGTNYRDPQARKGNRGQNMLLMFLSFSIISLIADCKKLTHFKTSLNHSAAESQTSDLV